MASRGHVQRRKMSRGRVRRAAGAPRKFGVDIVQATFVRGEPERVFDAFATAGGLDAWFTSGTTLDPRPGGAFLWRWRAWGPDKVTTEAQAKVREFRRPERFVFDWDSGNPKPTRVEITFERAEGGTVVRLRESGYDDSPRGRRAIVNCSGGWGEALTLAKFYVEHGLHY